jgi:hypothetical protein
VWRSFSSFNQKIENPPSGFYAFYLKKYFSLHFSEIAAAAAAALRV